MSKALDLLQPSAVVESWAMCGVHRCMNLPQPVKTGGMVVPVLFDRYKALLDEEKGWDDLDEQAELAAAASQAPAGPSEATAAAEQAAVAIAVAAKPASKPALKIGQKAAAKPTPKKRGPGRPPTKEKPPPKNQPTLLGIVRKRKFDEV